MKESPISPLHRQWGAQMGTDAGWQMPKQYHSLIEEHRATRSSCGIFDISHIAKIRVAGNGAQDWLERMLSNNVARCRDGHAQRTLMLNEAGGILDKMTLLRESGGRFLLLGNAALAEDDYHWLARHNGETSLELTDETARWSAVALYGPDSELVVARVLKKVEIPMPMTFQRYGYLDDDLLLARVGLQGEEGFQFFCPAHRGIYWFSAFVGAGAVPCGFTTRENRRIAGGCSCCFQDVRGLSPFEVSLEGYCDRGKTYIGSVAVARSALNPPQRKLVTLRCPEDGELPASGSPVMDVQGKVVGNITSACIAPDSGLTFAFAMVESRFCSEGVRLDILLPRGLTPAVVLGPPRT